MPKLTKDMGEYCLSHIRDNELVVISERHDTGFDEYIAMKIDGVYKSLSTRKRKDECHLEIAYPRPGARGMEFEHFYETPLRFSKDRRFQGLLTIDITPYSSRYNTEEFRDLIQYLKEDMNSATILFVVSTDSFQSTKGISERLKNEMEVTTTYLPLPSKERLLSYIRESVNQKKLFDERQEEIAKAIDGSGFEVREGIEKALSSKTAVPVDKRQRGRTSSFGY